MANEKVKIELPVVPTLDKRAARNVTSEIRDLERQLGPIKVSFDDLAKTASSSVKELNKVSSAATTMGKSIGEAVKKSNKALGDLSKGMKGVKGGGGGGGGGGGSDVSDAEEELVDTTEKLSDAMSDLLKSTKSQAEISKRAAKAQQDFAKAMKVRSKEKFEGFGDVMKDLPNLFKKGGMGGGLKGIGGGVGKMLGTSSSGPTAGAKAVSAAGGGGAAGAGAMGQAAGAMMKAGPYIAAAAAAIMAIAKVLQMASESQTKINKAMIDGAGYANDFGVSVKGYRQGIDEMRDAIQDTSFQMLKFGGNSELTAKIINKFTKESTGSLMQTRNQLEEIGGSGGLGAGVSSMAKAATAYGKALGMEAEDAAAMMGKFTNELGMSAQGSMDSMQNIVKAAAQSNMPMTKFMGIFNSVIPDVELYQNRLEELTGTIKLLSKTMSAKDIKNFSDAFTKGFKGSDFKQRLKTVLVTGTENVSKALEKDFDAKARSMAKNFSDYGIDEEEVVKAMKGGESAMAALINKAQGKASEKGTQLQGSVVSDAMKLAGYEATRQKGGAPNMATALSGAGEMATYNILKQFGGTLTKGFDGISEHVMKQLGISEQQYEALRTTAQSLKVQKDQLAQFGETNSKSMNTALKETIRLRKEFKGQSVDDATLQEAMKTATDDELFAAAARQKANKKDEEKAFDLAAEQYDVTTSIGDKLDNVISFLLEQILRVLNPILDIINDLLGAFLKSDKKKMDGAKSAVDDVKFQKRAELAKVKGGDVMIDQVGDAIQKGLASGKTGTDLAGSVARSGAFGDQLKELDSSKIFDIAKSQDKDISGTEALKLQNRFNDAKKNNDVEGMLKVLDDLPGGIEKSMVAVAGELAAGGHVTDAAKAGGRGATVRADGTKSMGAAEKKKMSDAQIQAQQASDLKVLSKDPSVAAAAQQKIDGAIAAAKGPGGAMTMPADQISGKAPGAPPAAGGGPTAVKDTHAAIQETAKTQQQAAKTVDQQLAVQDETYGVMNDVASILKKGIKYENSWMGTKYKNVLKEATLDSFRTSLMEFAVLQVKLEKDSKLKDALAGEHGIDFAMSGKGGLDRVNSAALGKGLEALQGAGGQSAIPGFATGGPVDYDQMARVHAGEFVVPKGGALVKGAGGGNKTVNVTATINVTTDADPKQIAAAVNDLYRQH